MVYRFILLCKRTMPSTAMSQISVYLSITIYYCVWYFGIYSSTFDALSYTRLPACPPPGVCYLCSQPGDQPSHRSLPVSLLRRQPGGAAGHAHRPGRHLLHHAGRPRVPPRQDETQHLGSPHHLAAGGPLLCESTVFTWLNYLSIVCLLSNSVKSVKIFRKVTCDIMLCIYL